MYWSSVGQSHGQTSRIKLQGLVDNGTQIEGAHRSFNRMLGFGIGGADDLAVSIAPAGNQNTLSPTPMVTTGVFVDDWRASEFTGRDDQRIIEQAALRQVGDEHPDGSIVARQLVVERIFDVAMVVPITGIQRDKPHTCLDQAACQ